MNLRSCHFQKTGVELAMVWLLGLWMLSAAPFSSAAPMCLSGSPVVVRSTQGVSVYWRTGTEVDVIGFQVYRIGNEGKESIVNSRLVAASPADGIGGIYQCLDIHGAARYELGVVDLHGVESRMACLPETFLPDWAAALPDLPEGLSFQKFIPSDFKQVRMAEAKPGTWTTVRQASGLPVENEQLKVIVEAQGVYRITPEQMGAGLGMTVEEARERIVTRQFRLTSDGQRKAWIPDTNNAALLFYHAGGKTLYASRATYWLERGKGLVIPPQEGAAPAANAPASQSFTNTIRFEKDVIGAVFAYNEPEVDFWVWAGFYGGDQTNFPFVLEMAALTDTSIPVVVRVVGSSFVPHQADIFVNNSLVGTGQWEGKTALSITCNVPASLILTGTNSLVITNVGTTSSLFYLDYFDVTCRRYFNLQAECLPFSSDGFELITLGGFTNSAVRLIEVNNPCSIREIKALRVSAVSNALTVSFAPDNPTNRYFAFSSSAIHLPLSMEGYRSSGLKSATNAADYLVITTPSLVNSLQPLMDWRTRQGHLCRMLTVQQIADEFNHGVVTPHAMHDLLAHASSQWRIAPRLVLLGGKGTYDYRNVTGTAVNHVPVLLVPTSTYLFASDNALADFTGDDGVPEMAIGRLPATTSAEMTTMVSRIIAYEQDPGGDWTHRVVLTADDPDSGGNFPVSSDYAASLLPADLVQQRIYLTQYSVGTAKTMLINTLNNRVGLWNYFGHGGMNVLDGGWLANADATLLTNGYRAPLMLGMTCFIARHELPGYVSLGETLMTRTNGGVIALWAPTGLSYNTPAEIMNSHFLQKRYQQSIQPLGEAFKAALSASAQGGVMKDLLQIYTLLGDPGLVTKQ